MHLIMLSLLQQMQDISFGFGFHSEQDLLAGLLLTINYVESKVLPSRFLAWIYGSQHVPSVLVIAEVLYSPVGVARIYIICIACFTGSALMKVLRSQRLLILVPFVYVIAEQDLIVVVCTVVLGVYAVGYV